MTRKTDQQPTHAQEMAEQRVAIVERMMKLPYIKATRDSSVGQERFVARDDMITLIHTLAKESRAAAPAVEDAERVLNTIERIESERTAVEDAPREPKNSWWCCKADYPNHEPTCHNFAGDLAETIIHALILSPYIVEIKGSEKENAVQVVIEALRATTPQPRMLDALKAVQLILLQQNKRSRADEEALDIIEAALAHPQGED
jgi:hypothetical protein